MMPKKPNTPFPKRNSLSKIVEKTLKEHGGTPEEHRFMHLNVTGHLLSQLKLPPRIYEKASELEAHSIRLHEAIFSLSYGRQVPIRTIKRIVQKTVEQIPSYTTRNKDQLVKKEKADLHALQRNLQSDLNELKALPDEQLTTISPDFLQTALDIHLDEFCDLLGKKKFLQYMKALGATFRYLRKKPRNRKTT